MATNINLPTINIGGTSTTGAGDPTRPFYSPDVITPEQYFAGPVDFYRQTLGTGISVTDPTEEEEEREDTSPNIFEPIGGGDQPDNIFKQPFGGTYNPSEKNFSYGVQDVNDDVIGELTGVNFSDMTPSGINAGFDAATSALTDKQRASLGSFATSKAEVEKSLGFGSMIEGAFKSLQGTAKQIDTAMKSGNLSTQIDAMLGAPTAAKPYGTGVSAVGLPGAVAMMPPVTMFSGLAAGFGALNRSQQAQNAAAYKATGGTGGALMSLNGMSVSRAPGSFQYGGVLPDGWSTKNIQAFEAAVNGYIPGTLTEEVYNKEKGIYEKNWQRDLISGEDILNSKGTFNQNGYWTDVTGQTYGGTIAKQTDSYADALNKTITGSITSAGGTVDASTISLTKAEILGIAKQTQAATSWSLTKGIHLPAGVPTFQDRVKAAVKDKIESAYGAGALSAGGKDSGQPDFSGVASVSTSAKYGAGDYTTYEDDDTSTPSTPSTPSAPAEDPFVGNEYGDNNNNNNDDKGDGGMGHGGGGFSDRGGWGGLEGDARGGLITHGRPQNRTNFAPGGEAGFAQRPEFVGGNQTQPDGVSVADDQPRDVQEGTFVINAAAADFAGRDDIEKMIRQAYKKVGDTGQSGVSQEVAINVSKGEVMIPPHIAKVIGYDRLNKINNRGKKEIARRQEAAGGGFIDRKKFAAGDRVTLYRGEPLDPSKVVATDYGYGKQDVGKFHTPDVKKAGRFAAGAGKGNQVIKSRKVTIDELFDGVEEAWKTQAKKKTEYFAKLPKSELNKNLRFVRELKRAYLAGERSLDSMAMFLQEQVFHDDKSRINFIETLKNDPKSAGKLVGRALTKIATKATPPLAILGVAAEVFTPSDLGKSTLYDDSFMDYQFTPKE